MSALIIGRIILGLFFLMSGLRHFTNYSMMKRYAQSMRLPLPGLGVILTGVIMLFGALVMFVWGGLPFAWAQAGLWGLVGFLVITSIKMHPFWKMKAEKKMENMRYFMGNMALAAALLMVLGMYTMSIGLV